MPSRYRTREDFFSSLSRTVFNGSFSNEVMPAPCKVAASFFRDLGCRVFRQCFLGIFPKDFCGQMPKILTHARLLWWKFNIQFRKPYKALHAVALHAYRTPNPKPIPMGRNSSLSALEFTVNISYTTQLPKLKPPKTPRAPTNPQNRARRASAPLLRPTSPSWRMALG